MHVENDLYIRIGESPVGPFGPRLNIYHTSESDAEQEIYTYNAKAHRVNLEFCDVFWYNDSSYFNGSQQYK